jgi:hypothetical protein
MFGGAGFGYNRLDNFNNKDLAMSSIYRFAAVSVFIIACAGCTSVDVRPIPASAKLDKVCIQFNSEVLVDDFVPVVQEGLFDHGISSIVYHSEKPAGCEFTMSYTVNRAWDLAPYMVDARMTVNKDDTFIGSGHYHLNGGGGLDLGKFAGTHSKISPVMDELLQNYPKVDIGKAEKTAGTK